MAMIRIVLIDDHAVLRMGIRMLIESKAGMEIAGEAGNAADAVRVIKETQPEIVLLDIDLGETSGVDLIPSIRSLAPKSRVIVLTGVRDPEVHLRAVRAGAMGLVLKEQADESLLTAIEKVNTGEVWLSRSIIGSVFSELFDQDLAPQANPEFEKIKSLTAREREVIELLAEGLRNKQIGERLFISETTVRHHLSSIFAKLGLRSRFELIMYSHKQNLVNLTTRSSE